MSQGDNQPVHVGLCFWATVTWTLPPQNVPTTFQQFLPLLMSMHIVNERTIQGRYSCTVFSIRLYRHSKTTSSGRCGRAKAEKLSGFRTVVTQKGFQFGTAHKIIIYDQYSHYCAPVSIYVINDAIT